MPYLLGWNRCGANLAENLPDLEIEFGLQRPSLRRCRPTPNSLDNPPPPSVNIFGIWSTLPPPHIYESHTQLRPSPHYPHHASPSTSPSIPTLPPNLHHLLLPPRKVHKEAPRLRTHQHPRLPLWALPNLQTIQFWSVRQSKNPLREHCVREERDQEQAVLASQRPLQTALERFAEHFCATKGYHEGAEDAG